KKESITAEDYPFILNTLIGLLQFKALWPKLKIDSLPFLEILIENSSVYFDKFPAYKQVKDAIYQAQTNPQEIRKQLLKAALALIQIKNLIAATPTTWLKSALEELIISDHL